LKGRARDIQRLANAEGAGRAIRQRKVGAYERGLASREPVVRAETLVHLEARYARHQLAWRTCRGVGCLRTARKDDDERRDDRDEPTNTQRSHTPPPSPFGSIADQETVCKQRPSEARHTVIPPRKGRQYEILTVSRYRFRSHDEGPNAN